MGRRRFQGILSAGAVLACLWLAVRFLLPWCAPFLLGFAMAASNQLTDQSATATLALRESCKNILYTVANSGYYTNVEGDPTNQPDPLVSLLRTVDIILGAVLLVLLVLMIVVHVKNKKKRAA